MLSLMPLLSLTLLLLSLSTSNAFNGIRSRVGVSYLSSRSVRSNIMTFRQSSLRLKTEQSPEEIEKEQMENEAEDNLLIDRLNAEIMAESGVELDQLINPSKVVNLERDLVQLRKQILLTTNTDELAEIQKTIDKKTATLIVEKRGVMRGWLKNLFVGQSVLAGAGSLALVYQWVPTELPIQVLGFWMWWLFIIPSLR